MRLGCVARMDNTGLGIQTEGYYRHLNPNKTMVVDISKWNGNKQYPERYLNNQIGEVKLIKGFPTNNDVDEFLLGLDVVLIAEAAYNPYLYVRAKELGVKTAVAHNYEFFDWFKEGAPMPDMFIAPSMWHYAEVDAFVNNYNLRSGTSLKHIYLHCPVNRKTLPFKERNLARTFLHMAGKPAANDRNGTQTVIDAAKYLKTDAIIKIHFQGNQGLQHQMTHTVDQYKAQIAASGGRIIVDEQDFDNYEDCYSEGDILLLPRRYGGNCLPLNEALSTGMPVIMPDIEPNNNFLPREWLIPATKIGQFSPRTVVDIFEANPEHLARRIDKFFEMEEGEFMAVTLKADALAEKISWENLEWQYRRALEDLCAA